MEKDVEALDEALAHREERILSKALTFSAGGKLYCVRTNGPGTARRGARVTLLHFQDGGMRFHYKNRSLPYTHFKTNPGPDPAEDEKTLDARMAEIVAAHPAKPKAQPAARKYVDNGLLATALWGARVTEPLSTPTQTLMLPKGHSHVAIRGEILMLR